MVGPLKTELFCGFPKLDRERQRQTDKETEAETDWLKKRQKVSVSERY